MYLYILGGTADRKTHRDLPDALGTAPKNPPNDHPACRLMHWNPQILCESAFNYCCFPQKNGRAIARPARKVGGPAGPPFNCYLFKQAHELVNDTVNDFVLIVVLDQRTKGIGMRIERCKLTGQIVIDHA